MQKEMEKVRSDLEAAALSGQAAGASGSGSKSGSGSGPSGSRDVGGAGVVHPPSAPGILGQGGEDEMEEEEEEGDYRLSDESIEESEGEDEGHRAK